MSETPSPPPTDGHCPTDPDQHRQPYPRDHMLEMVWRQTLIFAARDDLVLETYRQEEGCDLDERDNHSVAEFVAWFNKRIWRENPYE